MTDCLLFEGITDRTKRTPWWDPEVGPLVNAGREASFCCHLLLASHIVAFVVGWSGGRKGGGGGGWLWDGGQLEGAGGNCLMVLMLVILVMPEEAMLPALTVVVSQVISGQVWIPAIHILFWNGLCLLLKSKITQFHYIGEMYYRGTCNPWAKTSKTVKQTNGNNSAHFCKNF